MSVDEKKGSRVERERRRRRMRPRVPDNVATLAVSNHRDPLAIPRRIRHERPDSPPVCSIASLFACEASVFPRLKHRFCSLERRRRSSLVLLSVRFDECYTNLALSICWPSAGGDFDYRSPSVLIIVACPARFARKIRQLGESSTIRRRFVAATSWLNMPAISPAVPAASSSGCSR